MNLGLPRDNGRQEAGYRANCLKPLRIRSVRSSLARRLG